MKNLDLCLSFLGDHEVMTLMSCSRDTRSVSRMEAAAYKISRIYMMLRTERWANEALREVHELHVFINRLNCNLAIVPCVGGAMGICHWKRLRKPLRLSSVICPACRINPLGVATYFAIGCKMVSSTPYLDFTCVDCSLRIETDWFSDYYHTPMFFYMRSHGVNFDDQ
jgi:hypothetical protein